MNFQNANKVKNESTSSFCNCGFFRNWSNVLFLQKNMKYLAIVLLCLILGSFGLYFIKYMPSKVIVPVAPKNDSLAIVGAKFDSLQLEIGFIKKNDSIKEIIMAKGRPGLSAEILSSSIISRFPEVGIPTGPLVGGATNVMENLIKVICEEVVDAIQSDMRIDVVTDAGATVSASGGNSGGPVVSVGATVANHTGIGVAR